MDVDYNPVAFTVPKATGSPIKAFGDDSLNKYLWRLLKPDFIFLTGHQ